MHFEERLINEIKKKESIWNKCSCAFRNKLFRDTAWREIAEKTGESEDNCRKRWKSLRDRFVQETKNAHRASSNGIEHIIQWKFYKQMYFLKDTVLPKEEVSNLSAFECSFDMSQDAGVDRLMLPESNCSLSSSESPRGPKRKIKSDDEHFGALLESMGMYIKNKAEESESDIDPFLLSIGEIFNLLPEDNISFKLDVLNYAHKKYEELKNNT